MNNRLINLNPQNLDEDALVEPIWVEKKILPKEIIQKNKTGWTVPIGHWLKNNSDQELTNFYLQSVGKENKMNTITVNAKVNKSLVPAWAYKSWKEKYNIKYSS